VTWLLLYAAAASVFILWATRRLFVAFAKGYVVETDDPDFGFEDGSIHRAERPRRFWVSTAVTAFLLVAAMLFLYFIFIASS